MINILILDTDIGIRNSLKLYLTEIGFHVEESTCVDQAWDILKRKKIDLIICDIIMPGMGGFNFLHQLRLNTDYCTLPVILLTTRGLTQDRIIGYKTGCDSYISKPFNIEELVVIIEGVLNRHTLIRLKLEKKQKNSFLLIKSNNLKINFTPREQSVLNLVVEGLLNKQIAANLNISIRIVEKYVSRLFIKTKTRNRAELVKYALENNLIT
uniref:Probable transcriptional regulator ycf29 n=1 Tax=Cyanophora paradoxa TaxID=2762 RepID=YCF29_CYAPA|nr:putative OmpR transcriptional regulator [Cyanophora paradoxa]P48359.1 RecName: Full=Probable transcriptional regulator ycf29 [Cyanophora paradoxa]AAA81207.1 putative OmpR transcriptional regulator [Cyanophora paradoxa]